MFVERNDEGKYQVRLEDGQLPSLYISPYYRKLLARRKHERRDPRVHQAKDQLGPMADRIDRAAPQHAHPRVAGDRRSPKQVSRRRPGPHRAAQDAANRRQGRRPRDDGQPGRRRQVDSNAARHLPAQAVLRRRHDRRRRRRSGLGPRADQAARDHRQRGQNQAAVG